ncbi:glucose 1-dehydrogenase [Sphingobium sp. AN641]|uniref:SDR family NAD(P)-dependent oxidoreductase n=1 Tax=Sphingobium sp. AN641 TaxID=3133443 RepID=UPI0030BB9E09
MKQYFDFSGKVALVTGGSRGLGAAISRAFAEQGANVVIASRNAENCEQLAAEIESEYGVQALGVGAHLGRWDDIDRLADAAYARFGKVDILVNNAGMSPLSDGSLGTPEALFDKVIGVNFKGPFRMTALVASRMAEGDGGSIINISSIGSIRPQPEYAPYSGAKAALNAVTIAHAFEYAPKVRVNAILPGSFRTDIAKAWSPDKAKNIKSAIKRYGEPEEIVSTVLYLASDHSSFTTGALIQVDGGRP